MVRMFVSALAMSVCFASPAAAALSTKDVQRCNAMAATLTPKKAEIQTLIAQRDAQAEQVEVLGDVWEESETMRNFKGDADVSADAHKADYDAAKAKLMHMDRALQVAAKQFNTDISDYNRSCAKK